MNPILPSLALCALLTALPVRAAPDPLQQNADVHEAQVLGWSADGKRVLIRLYLLEPFAPREAMGEQPFCEGYVNHETHYFRGGLVWLAYERGRLLATFPILDPQTCTPIAEAQQRLADARKQLATLGIRLEDTGQELVTPINTSSITVSQGPQAPYTLEYEERTLSQSSNPKEGTKSATVEQVVYVRKGATRQKVLSRKTSYTYATAMAGYFKTGLDRVWLSPSGSTLVVLGYEREGNMTGGRKSLRLFGMLGWSGSTLKPL